jgi:hypothetical protein
MIVEADVMHEPEEKRHEIRRRDDQPGDERVSEWVRWAAPIAIGALVSYFLSTGAINVALEGKASKDSVIAIQIQAAKMDTNLANYDRRMQSVEGKLDELVRAVNELNSSARRAR